MNGKVRALLIALSVLTLAPNSADARHRCRHGRRSICTRQECSPTPGRQVCYSVQCSPTTMALPRMHPANPLSNARVDRAKQLKAEAATYPRGCSDFISKVLQIDWKDANYLMGDSPTYVGENNNYSGLSPGDIVGWTSTTGSGHVAIYIGESGAKFIDVKDENQAPRNLQSGYGAQKLYKSSRY